MYDNFIDFYDNYPKSHINVDLWLDNNIKLFYIVNTWQLNYN